MAKKEKDESIPYHTLTTGQLIRRYLISRLPIQKRQVDDFDKPLSSLPIPESQISHIAVVIDGTVQDVMRAQDRLAALLLSGPEFIEFHPNHEKVILGTTKYINGEFVNEE